jgi:hypothetical protein
MLTITGDRRTRCDHFPRRDFLKIGALGLGGMMLPDLLRLEAGEGKRSSQKALINVCLLGGPPHQDMWDLKPDAPSEIRGEFRPIGTNVPGLQICELFPRLAKRADRFALIRGLVGSVNDHSYRTMMTGYSQDSLKSAGGHPAIGSVISKLSQSGQDRALPYVSLMGPVTSGYLGPSHEPYIGPFIPGFMDGRASLQLGAVNADRLRGRVDLLGKLDSIRRDIDKTGQIEAMDEFSQRAVEVVVSGHVGDALDLEKENPQSLKRYIGSVGRTASGPDYTVDNKRLLMARRLVEAGVRCVAMSWGGWDTHQNNFNYLRDELPALDIGLSALLDDLHERGLDKDVSVIFWGEFGRTPKINKDAGRDHWPQVSSALLTGGAMRTGQVVGESDRLGGEAKVPVHLHQIHATLYRAMGIDAATTQFTDHSGRPQYLLENPEPLRELIS